MAILDIQRRQMELGRIRLGDKGTKGQPQKLTHFRLTSPARHLLEAAAALYGGEVTEWPGAPSDGQFQLYTQTDVLPIIIPPGPEPVSQWYEQWTAGGCTHRCDGVRNHIDDAPCSCDPENRACKATTRVSVMLPDIPGVGTWRLETHGINAAYELPGTIDVIQMASQSGRFLTGRLRIEHRTSKRGGQTRKFIVPVIDLDVTVGQLMSGEAPAGELPAPGAGESITSPALPAGESADSPGPPPPADEDPMETVAREAAEGTGPKDDEGAFDAVYEAAKSERDERPITDAQRKRLFAVAREFKLSEDDVRAIVVAVTDQESTKGITRADYDEVIRRVEHAGKGDSLFGTDKTAEG